MPKKRRFNLARSVRTRKVRPYKTRKKKFGMPKPIGLPTSRIVHMRACYRYDFNNVVQDDASYVVISANDINNPFAVTGVTRPTGYDQWRQMYKNFCVIGAKCSAQFTGVSGAVANAYIVGCRLTNVGDFDPTNGTDMIATGTAGSYRILQTPGNGNVPIVRCGYSAKKFFGLKDLSDNLDEVGATFSDALSPIREAYFQVYALNLDPATDPGPIGTLITLDWLVLVSEPKDLPTQSLQPA